VRTIVQFVKATFIGGILFVVPLVAVALLAREAFRFLANVLKPLASLMPGEFFGGIVVADLLALLALIAICFLAGLVISTRPGRALSGRLEHLVLKRIPGFTLVKTVARGITGLESDSGVTTALVRLDDSWVLAFVVERHANGLVTVFVPSAPTPAVGSILFVSADRVQQLDVPMMTAVHSVMQLGVGSQALFQTSPSPPTAPDAGNTTPSS
jgi:uncharacterized membrane protein